MKKTSFEPFSRVSAERWYSDDGDDFVINFVLHWIKFGFSRITNCLYRQIEQRLGREKSFPLAIMLLLICLCATVCSILRCNIENVDSFKTPKTIESLDFPYGFGNIFASLSLWQFSFIFPSPFLRTHGVPTVSNFHSPRSLYFFLTHFISWPHLLFYDCFYSYIHKHTYVYGSYSRIYEEYCTQNTCQYIDGSKHESLFKFASDESEPLHDIDSLNWSSGISSEIRPIPHSKWI